MIDNSLYKLKESGIKFLMRNGCQIVNEINAAKTNVCPMFFAFSNTENDSIIYLIPFTTIKTSSQEEKIKRYLKSKGLKKNFYEIAYINDAKRAFKISSVFAVSSTMVEEWKKRGKLYTVENRMVINVVRNKLKVMLTHYSTNPKRSENKVIECVEILMKESQPNVRNKTIVNDEVMNYLGRNVSNENKFYKELNSIFIIDYAKIALNLEIKKDKNEVFKIYSDDLYYVYPDNTFRNYSDTVNGSIIEFVSHIHKVDLMFAIMLLKAYLDKID